MSTDVIQFPYNRYHSDPSRNMVVPGQWFRWVNNGLGRMTVMEDLSATEVPYVEVDADGSLTLHLRGVTSDINIGWWTWIDTADRAVFINRQSMLLINQKAFYLSGYAPTPDASITIDCQSSFSFRGIQRLCVWLEIYLDQLGGSNHDVGQTTISGAAGGVKTGTDWPAASPVTTPNKIWRPLCEVVTSTSDTNAVGFILHRHATGIIDIGVS